MEKIKSKSFTFHHWTSNELIKVVLIVDDADSVPHLFLNFKDMSVFCGIATAMKHMFHIP